MISFKNKRFSLLHALFFSSLTIAITFTLTNLWKTHLMEEQINSASSYACNYNIKRMNGFKFVKPLMFVDEECESEQLLGVKQQVIGVIDKYKATGDLTNASVYLREYQHNEWMCINETEKFDPGSLFKVPVLIAVLKMNELNPGFLNRSILYNKFVDDGKNVAYANKSIQLGHSYTIKELLTYMIKYSDNNATILLESNMNPKVLQKLFSDVGLAVPNIYATQYQFTTKEYSYFMRAIYNAGYLTVEDSEFAGELLSQCEFKEGIVKGLPPNTRLAHKFGESGTQIEKQLHESAIVYLENKPYLLTIMTRGKENKKLSQIIGELSQVVYNSMQSSASASM